MLAMFLNVTFMYRLFCERKKKKSILIQLDINIAYTVPMP